MDTISRRGDELHELESEGLHVDGDRILTYSQLRCPLGCRYCFVGDMEHRQEEHGSYLTPAQLRLLLQLPENIELIMLGCDTEFLLQKEDAFRTLNRLVSAGKDLSIITKLLLGTDDVTRLASIHRMLQERGRSLTFSVSIPCWESAMYWEPKAPTPQSRAELLRSVHNAGVPTLAAIRPLLPGVSIAELERIVEVTSDACDGYYSGSLYAKDPGSLFSQESLDRMRVEQLQPHWMPDGNSFSMISEPEQMEALRSSIERHGMSFFEGAADAIAFNRKR